jgi:hypothetical protein
MGALCVVLDLVSVPIGGDWALGRVAALFFYGVEQVTIDSCTFERLDGNAILINGYARGVVIQRNDFHEIGDNIIAQLGETKGAGMVLRQFTCVHCDRPFQ